MMKRRRSLIFALSLITALTTGTPAYATSTDTQNAAVTQEAAAETVEYTWNDDDTLTLNGEALEEGLYQVGEALVYLKTAEGSTSTTVYTGSVVITSEKNDTIHTADEEDTEDKLSAGTYYFTVADDKESSETSYVKNTWELETDGATSYYYYYGEDGLRVDPAEKAGEQEIAGDTYYLDTNGAIIDNTDADADEGVSLFALPAAEDTDSTESAAAAVTTGWVNESGKWIYYDSTGARDTSKVGRQDVGNGKIYYLSSDGTPQTGVFTVNGKLYSYNASAGTETAVTGSGWKQVNGTWYWLNGNGTAKTGWLKTGGKWYYLDPSNNGAMKTGFYNVNGTTYYSNGSGAMLTGWFKLGNTWYYANGSGAIAKGWAKLGGKWYYLDPSNNGAMKTGFYTVSGKRYYSNGSGAMLTGWQKINGTWYYFQGSGAQSFGWAKLKGVWYYLDPTTGAMKTGWYQVGGKWYYSYSSGAMAANKWIGNYYVTSSGAMATSTWIGQYYVGADGKWVQGYSQPGSWKKVSGSWYYYDENGKKVTGWRKINGYKYYFQSNGKLLQDVDSLIGRQSSYYITVNRAKCQITVYAKDETGVYCVPVKSFICSVGAAAYPTHTGTFQILEKRNPVTLMGPSYGQYGMHINNLGYGEWFHSVACSSLSNIHHSVPAAEYNKLGSPASHGCVRMRVGDAKWMYERISVGTTVKISDTEYCPFDRPTAAKIPATQNYDPTDPLA